MDKDEALKLALEALNTPRPTDSYPPLWRSYEKTINDAITAIKQALAADVQEPVATLFGSLPVYDNPTAAQRQWVGLTDEEIEQGCKESWVTEQAFQSAVWWAEAKLKEKNIAAQPAVPDAIIEAGESPDYRDGWNDCRQTMLEILKARTA
jgi:hypothetical protein